MEVGSGSWCSEPHRRGVDNTRRPGHSGRWAWVVTTVAVASWIECRYLAPTGWRAWSGTETVHAFSIALSADMYGVPLTICVR